MFDVIKEILISEKEFTDTNYERFQIQSINLYRKHFARF